jgi:hypothetical protein
LVALLREHKPEITRLLAGEEIVGSPAEVLDMARAFFGLPPEDRTPPIPKAPKGRDPFVYGRKGRRE